MSNGAEPPSRLESARETAAELLAEAGHADLSLASLRQSVAGLSEQLGSTTNQHLGLLINGSMTAAGVWAAVAFSGWLAALGVAWAVLNGYPLVLAAWRAWL